MATAMVVSKIGVETSYLLDRSYQEAAKTMASYLQVNRECLSRERKRDRVEAALSSSSFPSTEPSRFFFDLVSRFCFHYRTGHGDAPAPPQLELFTPHALSL